MSLIEDLAKLGDTLVSHELPGDISKTVGAIVKVLENEGVKVTDDLFPHDEPASGDSAEIDQLKARIAELEAQKAAPQA